MLKYKQIDLKIDMSDYGSMKEVIRKFVEEKIPGCSLKDADITDAVLHFKVTILDKNILPPPGDKDFVPATMSVSKKVKPATNKKPKALKRSAVTAIMRVVMVEEDIRGAVLDFLERETDILANSEDILDLTFLSEDGELKITAVVTAKLLSGE